MAPSLLKQPQRGHRNVRTLKPSRWKPRVRQDPQARNTIQEQRLGVRMIKQRAAAEEEWQNGRRWKPDGETGPEWFCEVKQARWLKHITWLRWGEERDMGSFTAQTGLTSLFTCSDCLTLKCYRYDQEFHPLSKIECIFSFSLNWWMEHNIFRTFFLSTDHAINFCVKSFVP